MKLVNFRKQGFYYQFDLYYNSHLIFHRFKYCPEDDMLLFQRRWWKQKHRWQAMYTFSPAKYHQIEDLCRQKWGRG